MSSESENALARQAWERNADYWDARMVEGNDFVNVLCWPNLARLLDIRPAEAVLDIACGNGIIARRLAALGARATAFDFSAALIAHAQARQVPGQLVEYHVLDATDGSALLGLGEGHYDAAVCNMALFDIADIAPLFQALARLLRPGGRFVYSVMHPCFNMPRTALCAERSDQDGDITTAYSLRQSGYITPVTCQAAAIRGQPQAQLIFHRPLQTLLAAGFNAGFVADALLEPTFPADPPQGTSMLGWNGNYHEFPPVLIVRMRKLEHCLNHTTSRI